MPKKQQLQKKPTSGSGATSFTWALVLAINNAYMYSKPIIIPLNVYLQKLPLNNHYLTIISSFAGVSLAAELEL